MKLFLKTKKYECEVVPHARLTWLTNLDDNNNVVSRSIIVRFPFRFWRRYTNPWSFQHTRGWCTYTAAIRFGKKISYYSMWEPAQQ
jgi:hypothetical protein